MGENPGWLADQHPKVMEIGRGLSSCQRLGKTGKGTDMYGIPSTLLFIYHLSGFDGFEGLAGTGYIDFPL